MERIYRWLRTAASATEKAVESAAYVMSAPTFWWGVGFCVAAAVVINLIFP